MAGAPRDPDRDYWTKRFGLNQYAHRHMSRRTVEQLERCKNDAARRLILGVSLKSKYLLCE